MCSGQARGWRTMSALGTAWHLQLSARFGRPDATHNGTRRHNAWQHQHARRCQTHSRDTTTCPSLRSNYSGVSPPQARPASARTVLRNAVLTACPLRLFDGGSPSPMYVPGPASTTRSPVHHKAQSKPQDRACTSASGATWHGGHAGLMLATRHAVRHWHSTTHCHRAYPV